jgi:hypothetical protein
MDTGKGIWYEMEANVDRMLWAASTLEPKRLASNVMISKASHSASTMIIPGRARRIITHQLEKALLLNPPQHWDPSTNRTKRKRSRGSKFSVITTEMGAPMNPYSSFQTRSQQMKMLRGATMNRTYVVAWNMPWAWVKRLPHSNNTIPGTPKIITFRYKPASRADSGSGRMRLRMCSEKYQITATGGVSVKRKHTMRWH